VIVAAGAIVGDDDDHAARLALPAGVSMLRLRQGRPVPIPSVERAEAIVAGLGPSERAVVEEVVTRIITGGPARVESGLLELVERTGADEVMLTSNVVDPDVRIRGLESLAAAFGLDGSAAAPSPAVAAGAR
jgi:alkanesulfonate monooxygenase SsuD/methylene tetrahydromethanopterin reductase-like flavin-dependent oxidoreductase (luciferase family)